MIRGFKFLTRDQQLELKPYLAPHLLKKLDEEISQGRHFVEKQSFGERVTNMFAVETAP